MRVAAAGVLSLTILIVWRIASYGISETLTQYALYDQSSPSALNTALAWSMDNSNTLYRVAYSFDERHLEQRIEYLSDALKLNPGDGRIAMSLAASLKQFGDKERADAFADQSVILLPDDANTLLQAGDYWWRGGEYSRAVESWGRALSHEPAVNQKLFPVFLRIMEQAGGMEVMRDTLIAVPAWFNDFFEYVMTNASNDQLVRRLFALRNEAAVPVTLAEQKSYLRFLEAERRWDEAFVVWANSLRRENLSVMGQPVNGGFEVEPTGVGFDWRVREDPAVLIKTDYTYGISGHKALHIIFRGQRVNFRHIEQLMILQPRKYRFRGQVRPDSLQAAAGVQWQLTCVGGKEQPFARSNRFIGVDQWRTFSFDFKVPRQDCDGQVLRLVSVTQGVEDPVYKGEIWFDDLSIEAL